MANAASRVRKKAQKAAGKVGRKREDLRFWLEKDDERLAQKVWANAKRIGSRTRHRRMQDLYYACLYDDAELAGAVASVGAIGEFTPQTLSTNICRRQVDAYTAKIAKSRPMPMGMTTGGNYSEQRRAKSLSKFFGGVLDEVKFWPTRTMRIRDAACWGSGFAWNYRVGRKIHHDRLFPWEVRVDPREARHGNPRTMYIERFVDRLVLMEQFPDFEEEIEEAESSSEDSWDRSLDEYVDLVRVVTAIHLPSGDNAKDGMRALCISNGTLEKLPYERPYFPVSKNDFSPGLTGWFGEGMVKQLAGLQYEVNSVGLRLQERNYLMGTYVVRREDDDLDYEAVDNGTLTEVVYKTVKPDFVTPAAAHPQLFEWFKYLRGEMPPDLTGNSMLSVRAEKPAGLDSKPSLRTYHDIEAEGFTPQGREDERDVIDTCWQFFDLSEEIYEQYLSEPESDNDQEDENQEARKPWIVRVEDRKHGRSVMQDLDYAKLRLDREKWTMRVFPTNFLRGTPEDQMQAVQEMIQAGFLSEDEAIVLLDFPDLERVTNLRASARRTIERLLESFKDADDPDAAYEYPDPALDLQLCKALGQMEYLNAKLDGVDPKNLKVMFQWVTDAIDMIDGKDPKAQRQAANTNDQPPGQSAPTDPGAGGGLPTVAPPTQPLLPAGAVAPTNIPAIPKVA